MADREQVWLDCDPGHDDAFAIILAGHSAKLNLVALSTSAGNQTLSKTTKNALDVLHASGLGHVPVYRGQDKPLMRDVQVCPEIHGESGLGGPTFAAHHLRAIDDQPAFMAIHQHIQANPGQLTIVCTGPLTNIGLLLMAFPHDVPLIRRIVIMGGAIGMGNTRPASEFNIECDPEAAKIVFDSSVPMVMVPLEVTHTALCTPAVVDMIHSKLQHQQRLTEFGTVISQLLMFFADSYRDMFGFREGPPLHDPCAVFYLLRPDCFQTADMRVDIETVSPLCYGRTVCDEFGILAKLAQTRGEPAKRPVTVTKQMNVDAFFQALAIAIEAADSVSPVNSGE
jgi:inosine-uridine nucleoside N-ribohydrolase